MPETHNRKGPGWMKVYRFQFILKPKVYTCDPDGQGKRGKCPYTVTPGYPVRRVRSLESLHGGKGFDRRDSSRVSPRVSLVSLESVSTKTQRGTLTRP